MIKNKLKNIKFLIALSIFIILQIIYIYASIVSDNDGSAFITKAEFETMKKDFDDQILNYKNSIDTKIDGAIAAYLSGIKVSMTKTINSSIYNAGKKNDIIFVGDFKTPDTKIGGHAEVAAQFLFKKDAGICIWKGSSKPSIGYHVSYNNYYFVPNHFCIKIGYKGGSGANWPCDTLDVRDINTDADSKNIVYRVASASTVKDSLYTSSDKCYDITPRTTLTSNVLGGGMAERMVKNGDSSTDVTWHFGSSSSFYDFSNKDFGYKTTTLQWSLDRGICRQTSYPTEYNYTETANCSNIVSCSESLFNTTDNKYIDYLAGKKIDENAKIYVVHESDWNKCSSTPLLAINDNWQNYIQYYKYGSDTPSGAPTLKNIGTYDGDTAATIGLPDVYVWMKKYKEVPIVNLVHNDWTVATNNKVNYYSGIPIFDSIERQVVEVKLKFTNSSTTSDGTFSVRDKAFDNLDLESSNIELFRDKELTQAFTDFNISSGTAAQTKTFYIDASADKTYWLKVCPSGDNTIKVESEEKFVSIVD